MKRETVLSKMRDPVILLTVALALNMAVLLWMGWHEHFFHDDAATAREQDSRIEQRRAVMGHLDEVLTMSARMAAATGDLRWEERYRRFQPQLDAAIQEARRCERDGYLATAVAHIESANAKRVEIESRAFSLIHHGRTDEAAALLFSEEYETQKRLYAHGMLWFHPRRIFLRLLELRGIIVHLDEVLTMSARMAAATGDLRWEERYRQFEPELDAAIEEAVTLAPEAQSAEAAATTDAANSELVAMENRAFDLVRRGRTDEARAILFSDEYETQKQVYAKGIADFGSGLATVARTSLEWESRRASFYLILAVVPIPLALAGWLVVLRAMRKWRAALSESNRGLARQAEELAQLNRALDRKVAERTAELSNANEGLKREIAERKKAEEQVRDLAKFPAENPNPVLRVARDGAVLYANEAGGSLLGAMGSAPDRPVPDAWLDWARQALATGEVQEVEVAHADRTYALRFMPVRDAGYANVYGEDVTDRKRAEQALRSKTALLEAQAETSIDAILAVNDQGESILFNARFGEMWSIPPEVLDTRDDDRILQHVLGQLSEPEEFVRKVRYLYAHKDEQSRDEIAFKDGRTIDRYSSPLVDSDGTCFGRIWFFRDITDRKQAEEVMRKSREFLQTVLDANPDPTMVVDLNYRVLLANRASRRLTPGKDPVANAMCCHQVSHRQDTPCDSQTDPCTLKEVVARKAPVTVDHVHYDAQGQERFVEVIAAPVFGEAGEVIQVVESSRDITDRKRAEQALADANRRLEELATTDDLTGLWNRRHFLDLLCRECQRTARSGAPLAVAMVDIDHFKAVNDSHGHPFGDRVLAEVARTMRQAARATDLVARYGGEEFMVLMPEAGAADAVGAAERLRRRIAEQPVVDGDRSVAVAVSIGVASLEGGADPTTLLRHVDEALYAAKQAGRNRTMVWTPDGPQPACSTGAAATYA